MQTLGQSLRDKQSADKQSTSAPSHAAYQVKDLGEGKKAMWTRIGAAFAHKDEKGFDVKLNSIPLDGRVVLRVADNTPKERDEE